MSALCLSLGIRIVLVYEHMVLHFGFIFCYTFNQLMFLMSVFLINGQPKSTELVSSDAGRSF